MKKQILLALLGLFCLTGCVEEIDTSNRFTFKGETVGSYLEKHDELYGSFNYVLNRSGLLSLLKAYGSYTCFAPTNEAMKRYLIEQDSIYKASLLPGSRRVVWTGITSPKLEDLTDSMCTVIAKTHVLPQGFLTVFREPSAKQLQPLRLREKRLKINGFSD